MIPTTTVPRTSRVLIVDQSDDAREVLRTILQRRGFQTYEAPESEEGLELARLHQPDVIVLDVESETDEEDSLCTRYDQSNDKPATLVVLGTSRRRDAELPGRRLVAKPYHYASLIRTIEQLLGQTDMETGR